MLTIIDVTPEYDMLLLFKSLNFLSSMFQSFQCIVITHICHIWPYNFNFFHAIINGIVKKF